MKLSIPVKVMILFIFITSFILLSFYMSLDQVKQEVIKNKQAELIKSTRLVASEVEGIFDSSIKNYFKGISETHLSTIKAHYQKYLDGEISLIKVKKDIEDHLLAHKIGASGYMVALDISKGRDNLVLAVHPHIKGQNISKYAFAQKAYEMKNGYIDLMWKNPNEKMPREKIAYLTYFEPLDWIISIAPYKDEFYSMVGENIFQKYLGTAEQDQKSGSYFTVFNTNGDMIYHPNLTGKNILGLRDTKNGELFIKNLIDNINHVSNNKRVEGWLEYSFTRRGKEVGPSSDKMFYYIYLPEYKWIVANVINKDEITESHVILKDRFLFIAFLILVGIIFIAIFVSNYINKRLLKLRKVAYNISNDNFINLIERTNKDEIGDLEEAFFNATNKVSQLLEEQKNINNNLELQVKNRTKELEEKTKQLEKLTVTDKLTGIYNRYKLDELLEVEINRAKRNHKEFGIILLDIDKFKDLNDNYGHLIGDKVLVEFAKLLKDNTRLTDCVGRWGGEEFLIFCPDTNQKGMKILANNLKRLIESNIFSEVKKVTASLGVASFIKEDSMETLIKRADDSLYCAKDSGRNCVVCS